MANLHRFCNDWKIGYRNENDEVIVDAFFDQGVYSFGSGSETRCPFGCVAIDGQYGIINEKGRIVEQLEYQDIHFMLDNLFMVKKGGKWGIFDAEKKDLVVPIVYDQINWEKGYNALVCKGDRWGAISFLTDGKANLSLIKANIPVEYLEIRILDENQRFYGVRRETRNEENQLVQGYTILDAQGKQLPGFEKTKDVDSQFIYYTDNLILTSIFEKTKDASRYLYFSKNEIPTSTIRKWGFMSINGLIKIPFKYDNVNRRKDGNFDVSIDHSWGVLSPSGKEIIAIKYSSPIPDVYKDAIVKDRLSKRYGILDEDGLERIPTIYEHLEVKDGIVFFGIGGYERQNFFSNINEAKWGCLNCQGVEIIPPIYDCFLVQDGVILAGYGGRIVGDPDLDVYDGVFDMYSYHGELIFGGFHEVYIKEDYYYFLLGASWVCEETSPFSVENSTIYKFSVKGASWLVLDKNLVSRKVGKNGKQIRFEKGGRVVIRTVEEEEKTIHYYNLDVSVLESDKEILKAGGSGLEKIIMEAHDSHNLYSNLLLRSNKYFNCTIQQAEVDYYDDDYAGTTWDAMTDGMYGDEPDGFDGDYSFMGRG